MKFWGFVILIFGCGSDFVFLFSPVFPLRLCYIECVFLSLGLRCEFQLLPVLFQKLFYILYLVLGFTSFMSDWKYLCSPDFYLDFHLSTDRYLTLFKVLFSLLLQFCSLCWSFDFATVSILLICLPESCNFQLEMNNFLICTTSQKTDETRCIGIEFDSSADSLQSFAPRFLPPIEIF